MKIFKKFPIIAGMKFTYPNITDVKLRVIGHRVVEFNYSDDNELISERIISKTFI